MSVSYKKLWHLLLDKNMKKRDLQRLTGISDYTIKKLTRDENVPVAVLGKISRALDCFPATIDGIQTHVTPL